MDYLPQIAQQGLLGVIVVISWLAIFYLYRENKSLQEKRVTDWQTLLTTIQVLKPTLDTILGLVQRMSERRR